MSHWTLLFEHNRRLRIVGLNIVCHLGPLTEAKERLGILGRFRTQPWLLKVAYRLEFALLLAPDMRLSPHLRYGFVQLLFKFLLVDVIATSIRDHGSFRPVLLLHRYFVQTLLRDKPDVRVVTVVK